MSYTPENQKLQPGIDATLDGIKTLRDAAMERLRNRGEWREEHLSDMEDLVKQITALEFRLLKLKEETR
jgi:hypothetical protein